MADRITRFRWQNEGDQQFEQRLRSIGVTGDNALGKVEKAAREVSGGLLRLDTASRKAQEGFGFLRSGALAISGALAGIAGGALSIREVTGQIAEFQVAFNNVRTLIDESTISSARLSRELRELPPVLGSSAELARGLYQTLSAGVAPADAVRFVGQAAAFSKAALVDTSLAVNVATTAINAFGLESNDAERVFDSFLRTIQLGKLTGQDIAQFLGPALVSGQALGLTFKEVEAAYASLTKILTPNKSADALNSLFLQLSVHGKDLRAASIDLQDAIGRGGLQAVLDDLAKVTGLNSEALQKLVGDQNAVIGAQILAGVQAETYRDNLKSLNDTVGLTAEAQRKQAEGLTGAWEELKNTFDRIIQRGTPVANALEAITRAATRLLEPLTAGQLAQARAELTRLEKDLETANKAFFPSLLAVTPEDIRKRIQVVRDEIAKLEAESLTPLGPSREQLEQGRRLQVEQIERDKAAAAARQKLIDEEAKKNQEAAEKKRKAAEATEQYIDKLLEKAADDEEKRIVDLEKKRDELRQKRVEKEAAAAEAIHERFRQREEDRIRRRIEADEDEVDRRVALFEKEQAALDAAQKKQEAAAKEAAERLARPFVELGNDIAESLSDAIVNGLFSPEIEDRAKALIEFLERSFADFAARLLQQRLFDPLFAQIGQGAATLAKGGAPGGVGGTPIVGAGLGGSIAAQSTTGASAALRDPAIIGVVAAAVVPTLITALGGPQALSNAISQGAIGAVAGGALGGLPGALVGGALGALVGSIGDLFGGGEQRSRARLVTSGGAVPASQQSDRFTTRSPFGFLSIDAASARELDVGEITRFIRDFDEQLAELLTDRQEQIVKAILQTQPAITVEGPQEDIAAQLVFDRVSAALEALAPGIASKIFEGIKPTAENIDDVVETFEDAVRVLSAIEQFNAPSAPLTEAEQALKSLNETFDELTDQARRFELGQRAIADIERERLRQQQQLIADFDTEIRRQTLSFTDPRALELELLEERRQTALREARALGADIAAVERRFAAERLAIIERFSEEAAQAFQQPFNFADTAAGFTRSIRQQGRAITAPLQLEFERLFEARTEALERARELGASISAVEQTFAEKRLAIIEAFNSRVVEATRRDFAAIDDVINRTKVSELGGGSISQRLDEAIRQFQVALGGGDEQAVARAAETLLEIQKQATGSTAETFARQREVFRLLEEFRARESARDEATIRQQQDDARRQLELAERNARREEMARIREEAEARRQIELAEHTALGIQEENAVLRQILAEARFSRGESYTVMSILQQILARQAA